VTINRGPIKDLEVKEWKPAEGCKQCSNALRIFNTLESISRYSNSLAIRKIKEQARKIEELEGMLLEMGSRD
jgi:hypothetical protein